MNLIFYEHLFAALAIGLVTGLFSGAFGIGGGTISTPLLRMTLDLDAHTAIGTTMALIIPTAITSTITYYLKKEINLSLGFAMVVPAVIGVLLGTATTMVVHGTHLMLAFAAFVFIAGLDLTFGLVQRLFLKGGAHEERDSSPSPIQTRFQRRMTIMVVGLCAGFMAGFFGVGGGFIFIPCMMYFFKLSIKAAFGTTLLIVAFISIPGTISHYIAGHVNFPLMFSMMGGSIPGGILGSTLAMRLKDSWLRHAFGGVMLVVALLLSLNEMDVF